MTTFEVTLNWNGELHRFYTTAKNQEIAKRNAIDRLGKQLKISRIYLLNHLRTGDKATVRVANS